MSGRDELRRLRAEIDEIDRQWVLTLARRFAVTEKIGALKTRERLPSGDPDRESTQLDVIHRIAAENGVDPLLVEKIFRLITERVRERHRELGAG